MTSTKMIQHVTHLKTTDSAMSLCRTIFLSWLERKDKLNLGEGTESRKEHGQFTDILNSFSKDEEGCTKFEMYDAKLQFLFKKKFSKDMKLESARLEGTKS